MITTRVSSGSSAPALSNSGVNCGTTDGEQHHDRQAGHDQQDDRVDQRGAHLLGQLLGLVEILGEPAQHVVQAAACLAGPNHADIGAGEHVLVLVEGIGERAARLDPLQQIGEQAAHRLARGQVAEQAQGLIDRQAGIEQRGQLAGHDRDLAATHPSGAEHGLAQPLAQGREPAALAPTGSAASGRCP